MTDSACSTDTGTGTAEKKKTTRQALILLGKLGKLDEDGKPKTPVKKAVYLDELLNDDERVDALTNMSLVRDCAVCVVNGRVLRPLVYMNEDDDYQIRILKDTVEPIKLPRLGDDDTIKDVKIVGEDYLVVTTKAFRAYTVKYRGEGKFDTPQPVVLGAPTNTIGITSTIDTATSGTTRATIETSPPPTEDSHSLREALLVFCPEAAAAAAAAEGEQQQHSAMVLPLDCILDENAIRALKMVVQVKDCIFFVFNNGIFRPIVLCRKNNETGRHVMTEGGGATSCNYELEVLKTQGEDLISIGEGAGADTIKDMQFAGGKVYLLGTDGTLRLATYQGRGKLGQGEPSPATDEDAGGVAHDDEFFSTIVEIVDNAGGAA